MKTFLTVLTVLGLWSGVTQAQSFSAFVQGDTLYVTVLGDTCNHYGGSLIVSEFCRSDRSTRNAAPTCDADLMIISTQMYCGDQGREPRVLQLSLSENYVDPYSHTLNLTYGRETIQVKTGK